MYPRCHIPRKNPTTENLVILPLKETTERKKAQEDEATLDKNKDEIVIDKYSQLEENKVDDIQPKERNRSRR